MDSQSREQETQTQISMFTLDGLYCEEDRFDEDLGLCCFEEDEEANGDCGETVKKTFALFEHDLFWEDDELERLLSKEKESHLAQRDLSSDGSLMEARKEAVDWILRANGHYGFTTVTAVLAANYFDRFISTFSFPRDKPWMSQLSAVACLSLAAKVEETQVPLLLDLQVEESKFVFEAKTIQRMELLVLSTLQWKMNPITPLLFVDHIIRRLGTKSVRHQEFLLRCERILLSTITDSRFMGFLPSVIATAAMLLVNRVVEPCNGLDFQNQLMGLLRISKEKVDKCSNLILELLENQVQKQCQTGLKRKHRSIPGSPIGVIEGYFSCDSSNDSWASEPLFKKSRIREQQMRLVTPINRAPMSVLSSLH